MATSIPTQPAQPVTVTISNRRLNDLLNHVRSTNEALGAGNKREAATRFENTVGYLQSLEKDVYLTLGSGTVAYVMADAERAREAVEKVAYALQEKNVLVGNQHKPVAYMQSQLRTVNSSTLLPSYGHRMCSAA